MSRQNKVNKSNYDQGGRLTPDELANERMNQTRVSGGAKRKDGMRRGARPARAERPSVARATRKRSA